MTRPEVERLLIDAGTIISVNDGQCQRLGAFLDRVTDLCLHVLKSMPATSTERQEEVPL